MKVSHEQTFREETGELLGELEHALLELEQEPQNPEPVGQVFRVLHTLKGSAAMVGFSALAQLVHELESIYEGGRAGKLPVGRTLISRTLVVRDGFKRLLSGSGGAEDDHLAKELMADLRSFHDLDVAPGDDVAPYTEKEEGEAFGLFGGWQSTATGGIPPPEEPMRQLGSKQKGGRNEL